MSAFSLYRSVVVPRVRAAAEVGDMSEIETHLLVPLPICHERGNTFHQNQTKSAAIKTPISDGCKNRSETHSLP